MISNLGQALDMSQVSDKDDYKILVREHGLFARVTPFQKQKIVTALQHQGRVVGMTGDGINDIPALKMADCSVAIADGSDAAKNSADLVLLDNDLSEMIPAVYQGRRIINNIERAAMLFLTKTVYMSLLAFLFIFFEHRFPLFPIQMTLISSGAIGIPGFLLSLIPNKNRVKKNFWGRTLSVSVPVGLAASLLVVVHQFTSAHFHLSQNQSNAVSLYILLTISLSVLWLACRPFNKYTFGIWLMSLALILVAIFIFPQALFLESLSPTGLKYTGIYIIITFITHYIFRRLLGPKILKMTFTRK